MERVNVPPVLHFLRYDKFLSSSALDVFLPLFSSVTSYSCVIKTFISVPAKTDVVGPLETVLQDKQLFGLVFEMFPLVLVGSQ